MKIVFIDPPFKTFTGISNPYFPLGLAYLSAVCNENGHKSAVYEVDATKKLETIDIDASNEHQRLDQYKAGINDLNHPLWNEIVKTVKDQDPDVIGISVMTTKLASAVRTAELLKRELVDVPIVFGGPHATLLPEQCFSVDAIDFLLRGECERTILQFLSFIKGDLEISNVNNLSYKNEKGEIIHNSIENPIENLDDIPFPDRESLLYKNNYVSEDMGIIMATRGCPYRCTYCAHIFGRKIRKRSVDNVLEEIRHVKKKYGTIQFSFKDDTFSVDKKWVTNLCNKLIDENFSINWDCTTRANLIDGKLINLMKKAGCNDIRLGIETGSQRILDETKKGVTFEQMRNAAKILNENHVLWTGYFMYGLPTETGKDMMSTYEFMRELNPNYAGLGLYNPFPKTDLFEKGVELGLLDGNVGIDHFLNTNPKDYYFKNPSKRVKDMEPHAFFVFERDIQEGFRKHNKNYNNLFRRAISRKDTYLKHPKLFVRDIIRGFKMIC